MSTNSVVLDSLTLGGLIFPPSGTTERFSIVFPASYTVTDTLEGAPVQNRNPSTSAVLTISCLPTDAAHVLMQQLQAQQSADDLNPSARAPKAGSARLASGDAAVWQDCRITQAANLTSSMEVTVVTWTVGLVGASRVLPAAV